jgi:hypothetical protein
MNKQVTATFELTEKEIREALYDFYVRKLKSNNINAVFSQDSIDISELPYVCLQIVESKELF